MNGSLKMREWQEEAWSEWIKNQRKGIIQAGTGSGKSYLFIKAIYEFPDEKILIVVPTQALMYQHKTLIENLCNIEVGLIGDGHNESKQVTIAVINSVRQKKLDYDILVCDEAHRYFSKINKLLFSNEFKAYMFLSATIERDDKKHLEFVEQFKIIYNITQEECIRKGWLCPYRIINIALSLNADEQLIHDEADAYIRENFGKFKTMDNIIRSLYHPVARAINKSIQKRREILCNASSKLKHTASMLLDEPDKKTIIFCEYQKSADILFKVLKDKLKIGIYHSGLKLKERRQMLEKFEADEYTSLISVRCLDEGLDVARCERAIILSGSSVERQFIQRIGRVLRYLPDKSAEIVQLFIADTKDEDWMQDRLSSIDESFIKVEYLDLTIKSESLEKFNI